MLRPADILVMLIGGLLLTAGSAKLFSPSDAAKLISQHLPMSLGLRVNSVALTAVRLVAVFEISWSVVLVSPYRSSPTVRLATLAIAAIFTAVSLGSLIKSESCGCFGSGPKATSSRLAQFVPSMVLLMLSSALVVSEVTDTSSSILTVAMGLTALCFTLSFLAEPIDLLRVVTRPAYRYFRPQ